jgi:protein-tyrosine phosphatase
MSSAGFDPSRITELDFGFPGRVFRSPMPFGSDTQGEALIDQYKQANIQAVVNLLTLEESRRKAKRDLRQAYLTAGMQMIAMPIQDFGIPDEREMAETVDTAVSLARSGENIVVHCYAGFGRTGTFLACMAVKVFGMPGYEAIEWVRDFVPHAVENEDQIEFIINFGEKYADHQR